MLYRCNNCGEVFDEPHRYVETHGFTDGLYETMYCCPCCGGDYDEFDPDAGEVEDDESLEEIDEEVDADVLD